MQMTLVTLQHFNTAQVITEKQHYIMQYNSWLYIEFFHLHEPKEFLNLDTHESNVHHTVNLDGQLPLKKTNHTEHNIYLHSPLTTNIKWIPSKH